VAKGGVKVDVESIFTHPEYDINSNKLCYDVAVWKLAPAIEEDEGITYAILPEAGFDRPTTSRNTVAGWYIP
jgi:hypothetical protein